MKKTTLSKAFFLSTLISLQGYSSPLGVLKNGNTPLHAIKNIFLHSLNDLHSSEVTIMAKLLKNDPSIEDHLPSIQKTLRLLSTKGYRNISDLTKEELMYLSETFHKFPALTDRVVNILNSYRVYSKAMRVGGTEYYVDNKLIVAVSNDGSIFMNKLSSLVDSRLSVKDYDLGEVLADYDQLKSGGKTVDLLLRTGTDKMNVQSLNMYYYMGGDNIHKATLKNKKFIEEFLKSVASRVQIKKIGAEMDDYGMRSLLD